MCPCWTAGYNGNLFETSKGPKGGDFDKEKDSSRFVVGQGNIIPGLDEGIRGMQAGGVRQIVVPPEVCSVFLRIRRKSWCFVVPSAGCWVCVSPFVCEACVSIGVAPGVFAVLRYVSHVSLLFSACRWCSWTSWCFRHHR